MKWTFLVVCLVPFASLADGACNDPFQLVDKIKDLDPKDIVEPLASFLVDHAEDKNFAYPGDGARGNIIYDTIVGLINGILPTLGDITVDSIGAEGGKLYVENAVISGLSATTFVLEPAKTGFNVNNLSFIFPNLVVTADKYTIKDVDLGIIALTGEGKLKISLENFFFNTHFNAKLAPGISLEVTTVPGIWLGLGKSQFELENLGSSGDAISGLLNGIATDLLPFLINSVSNDLNAVWECSGLLDPIVSAFMTVIMNTGLCVARGTADLQHCLCQILHPTDLQQCVDTTTTTAY